MDDSELLARYAADRAESAFAELVHRHVDSIYSAALRQLAGNHHLAQDVTQMVFVDLARKAAALSRHPSLVGWLHRCTRYAVFNVRRSEARRRALNAALTEDPTATPQSEPSWHDVGPILDDAVDQLREKDRAAILLRFFARKPFADVGRELGLSENAARMRVDRAIEALREVLETRGIRSTSSALGTMVAANLVNAAPSGVASGVAAAVASATPPAGAVLSALYTMSKIKVALTATLAVVGAIGLLVEFQSRNGLHAQVVQLRAAGDELARARAENRDLQQELQATSSKNPEAEELNRVRNRIALLKSRPPGVSEALMKPIVPSGRATPEAAYATFLAATNAGDLDGVAQFVSFRDGPPSDQQREEFMSKFEPVIREKYRSPERLFAAAYVGVREGVAQQPQGATYQVLGSQEIFPGVFQVRLWVHGPNGERELKESFQKNGEGWSIVFRPLVSRTASEVQGLLEPATGTPKATQK